MKCYNECGKDVVEGKYFCSKECKVEWNKRERGLNPTNRIRKLTISEMRAEIKTWKPRQSTALEAEEVFEKGGE